MVQQCPPICRYIVHQEALGQAHMTASKASLILYAWWVLLIVLSMRTEDAEHEKAGAVRKVASEPQGLHALQGKDTNGLHRSEINENSWQPGAALALPPCVYAAMHTIEEAHTEQCEGTNGDALPVPNLKKDL